MRILLKIIVGLCGIVVLLLLGFVAFSWAPDRTVDELKGRWAPPPSTFIEVAGTQVHMRDEGPREDAIPIVLLHGTSASLHTWDGWVNGVDRVDGLKQSRRVIRLDLPGFGLTGPFPDDDYMIGQYEKFMQAFLDKLGVAHCVLAGNSFGGQVALVTALGRPSRVDRLILVDSAGYPLAPTVVPLGFRIARLPVLNQIARVTLPRRIVEESIRNVYGDPSRVTPELIDRYFELTLREGNRRALAERLKHVLSDAITARIPEVNVPTLILWGGLDRLIAPEAGQRFAKDIAGSQLQIFDALGHLPHEEDPALTLAAVKRFLGLGANSKN
ncbi:MAG: alpha/beta hydrolase [Burkholderiales bacterium]|nr:alpha/beta hydrolase [Burkholderiales bacterium]